jgi:ferredoxin
MMKANVDEDLCTGCELCTQTCPDVFEMQDDVAVVTVDEIPEDAEDCAKQAAEECPVEAIKIE